jgi:hypothetical protein
MATPPNPLENNPAPPHAGTTPHQKIICEFCGCKLAPSGEVLELGEKAKAFSDHPETKEKLEKRIGELEADLRNAHAEIAALKEKDSPPPDAEATHYRGVGVKY